MTKDTCHKQPCNPLCWLAVLLMAVAGGLFWVLWEMRGDIGDIRGDVQYVKGQVDTIANPPPAKAPVPTVARTPN